MPTSNSHPNLHKTKSRIRLRLGLTPPHPKAVKQPEVPVHSFQPTIASHTMTSATNPLLVPQSPIFETSLNNSTNTFSSQQSRNDSRDAFAYVLPNSQNPDQVPVSPAFDVVSRATASPTTIARDALEEPRMSPARMLQHTRSHPNIAAAASADEVILMTDQELSDRFTFMSEIGFGNWGSVWLCKPKHCRASAHRELGGVAKLGKMAAAGGGSGAGGKVALKLVHRTKTIVSVMAKHVIDPVADLHRQIGDCG